MFQYALLRVKKISKKLLFCSLLCGKKVVGLQPETMEVVLENGLRASFFVSIVVPGDRREKFFPFLFGGVEKGRIFAPALRHGNRVKVLYDEYFRGGVRVFSGAF